jgi:hypothetical protein
MGKCTEAAQKLLEPLKHLHLKGRWELKTLESEKGLDALDAALKAAGFNCFVTKFENAKPQW